LNAGNINIYANVGSKQNTTMTKIVLGLIIILAITEISLFGQIKFADAVGEYQYIHNVYDSASLTLKSDSTYSYCWEWKQLKGITTGKWTVDKKYLFLNSDIQPPVNSKRNDDWYEVRAINRGMSDKLKIQFMDLNESPLQYADCWVITKGKILRGISDSTGIIYFNIKAVKHISVVAPFAQKGFITFKDNYKHNDIEIRLLNVNQEYLYMTNKKLALNILNGNLYLHETFYDPRSTNIFKKVR
jgi:hypothetical protein